MSEEDSLSLQERYAPNNAGGSRSPLRDVIRAASPPVSIERGALDPP
jgi:hypothetical protein